MEQDWQRQLADLVEKLMGSRAKWKIVFGHHPPRSNGHHNNTVELMQHVEPLLQVGLAPCSHLRFRDFLEVEGEII